MAVIKIVKGNLLDATEDIIAHQVNCMGVMGAGIAKQIKAKWPNVYREYKKVCEACEKYPSLNLGQCQLVLVDEGYGHSIIVANLFAQDDYGRTRVFTREDAFRTAIRSMALRLKHLSAFSGQSLKTIAMPYKIGCGLAGGNWDNIYKIIEEELSDFEVTLYKLED